MSRARTSPWKSEPSRPLADMSAAATLTPSATLSSATRVSAPITMPPMFCFIPATSPCALIRPWVLKPRPQIPTPRRLSPPCMPPSPSPLAAGSTRCMASWLNRLLLPMPGCADAACAARAARPSASPPLLRMSNWWCWMTLPMLSTSAASASCRVACASPRSAPACCRITSRSENCSAPSSGFMPARPLLAAAASARPRPSPDCVLANSPVCSKPVLAVSHRPSALWCTLKLSSELARGRNTSPSTMLAL